MKHEMIYLNRHQFKLAVKIGMLKSENGPITIEDENNKVYETVKEAMNHRE